MAWWDGVYRTVPPIRIELMTFSLRERPVLAGGTCCTTGGFGVRVPVKPLRAGGTPAPRAFPCPSGVWLVPAGATA